MSTIHIFLGDARYHDPPEPDAAAILFPSDNPQVDQARGFDLATEQIAIGQHRTVTVYRSPRFSTALLCGVLLACAAQRIIPEVVEVPAEVPATRRPTQPRAADPQVDAAFTALIARITASDSWQVWRYDQAPLRDQRPQPALLTLRDPAGQKILLTFADGQVLTTDQTVGYNAPDHQHVGRRIDTAWIDIEGKLRIAMPPTKNRDEDVITVIGVISSITEI